ncbi:MAG: VTT domain-containing protein [Thermoanaerobaculia bacterium]
MRALIATLRESWRFIALVALPLVVIAVVAARMGTEAAARWAVVELQAIAGEWWAIPAYALVYIIGSFLLLPVGVLAIAGALAWGWKLGGTIELLTCVVAALGPYYLAHGRAAPWIERKLARVGAKAPSFTGPDGTFVLLLLRVVPVLPFVAMNYVAGLAKVRTRDYVLTTFGVAPSVYVFAYFIDTMAAAATGAATQLRLLLACAAVAVLLITGRVVAKRL